MELGRRCEYTVEGVCVEHTTGGEQASLASFADYLFCSSRGFSNRRVAFLLLYLLYHYYYYIYFINLKFCERRFTNLVLQRKIVSSYKHHTEKYDNFLNQSNKNFKNQGNSYLSLFLRYPYS